MYIYILNIFIIITRSLIGSGSSDNMLLHCDFVYYFFNISNLFNIKINIIINYL